MNFTDEQKTQVTQWVGEGMDVMAIAQKFRETHGVGLTHLDVRLLLGDLNLVPKDKEKPQNDITINGKVIVELIKAVTRPDSILEGTVTFSDGEKTPFHVDHQGRLHLHARQGYKPTTTDLQDFQTELNKKAQEAMTPQKV